MAANSTYSAISKVSLSSNQSSITISSIPQTYTDLRLTIKYDIDSFGSLSLRFNSDSSALYSFTSIYGNGSTLNSYKEINKNLLSLDAAFGLVSGTPYFFTLDIPNYISSSYNKTVLIEGNADRNGAGIVYRNAGAYRSTSPITSLTLFAPGCEFISGTVVSLFGIKEA